MCLLMDNNKQYCPICNNEVRANPRYPNYICHECTRDPTDENGRLLDFYNESLSGGFIAQYRDTKEVRDSHICFIKGIKCYANEARFGGIVIIPCDSMTNEN